TETSHGKWHLYWVLRDCQLEQFQPLQRRLIKFYGSDKQVNDLPRVMRVPGFYHRKGAPFLSRLVFAGDAEYTLEEFVEGLPEIEAEKKREAPRPEPGDGSPHKFRDLNSYALDNLDLWFPALFPQARKSNQGWRVSSETLGRNLEEDISATPQGIVDF